MFHLQMGTPMEVSIPYTTFAPNESEPGVTDPAWDTLLLEPEKHSCNQYVTQNKTSWLHTGYEGIPENLLINFLAWIVSLCLHFPGF